MMIWPWTSNSWCFIKDCSAWTFRVKQLHPDNEGNMTLWNIRNYLPRDRTSRPKWSVPSATTLWEPHVSQGTHYLQYRCSQKPKNAVNCYSKFLQVKLQPKTANKAEFIHTTLLGLTWSQKSSLKDWHLHQNSGKKDIVQKGGDICKESVENGEDSGRLIDDSYKSRK